MTVLAPGNSMDYRLDATATATVTGNPDDFGPHVDDQRELYWDYGFKDGRFVDGCEAPEVPRAGIEICWSDHGVPAVFADTTEDLGYGAGYAHARLRLFLIDAIRRMARGTLAELAGPGTDDATLAEDVRTRYQGYSDADLTAMYEGFDDEARTMVDGYVDGVNARIAEVTSTAAAELPAEYALLQTAPQPLTPEDVVATGVLMTRFVASEGKREMMWVRALRALEETHGTELGRAIFRDFVWREDTKATTTILPGEGTFRRTDATPAEQDAAFEAMADFADTLPHDLDRGPGADPDHREPVPADGGAQEPDSGTGLPVAAPPSPMAQAVAALEAWRAALTGGSWQVSLAPSMTERRLDAADQRAAARLQPDPAGRVPADRGGLRRPRRRGPGPARGRHRLHPHRRLVADHRQQQDHRHLRRDPAPRQRRRRGARGPARRGVVEPRLPHGDGPVARGPAGRARRTAAAVARRDGVPRPPRTRGQSGHRRDRRAGG